MITATLGAAIAAALLLTAAANARAASPSEKVGIVSNINITSDKVPDVSSIEAWKNSYIKPGMTDAQKAMATWKSVVTFQHQNAPPVEYLASPENVVLDPIKMFNVYGYALCSVHASHMAALARAAGLKARNQTIVRHCVPEIWYDNGWHLLDSSLVNFFPKPDGSLASIDEIIAATKEVYDKHPELKGKPEALDEFRKEGKWKSEGAALLANCPFYDKNGLFVANWPWQCGWMETMREYDGSTQFIYEPGYSMGYRVNVQLRPGEKLTRNWFNKGMHINMDLGDKSRPTCLDLHPGEGSMSYLTDLHADLAPGRIGNGVIEYNVPIDSSAFRGGALVADNLLALMEVSSSNRKDQPAALTMADPAKPGTLVIRMPSSYVYLGGDLNLDAVIGTGGKIQVLFSENNGLDFREIQSLTSTGKTTIDLKPLIYRRYDYQLKFVLTGEGTGLNALNIREDIQHSQAPLPALAQGDNTITFSAGNEGTITLEGSTQNENKGKQVLASDFHLKQENIGDPMLSVQGKTGWVEFPIATPVPMTRLRVFSFYRARGEGDNWSVTVSYDNGKTWKDVGQLEAPFKAMGKQFTLTDLPANTTAALVRFTGTQKDGALLFNVRLDADYPEPHGGFTPVKITYTWEENGQEKHDTHIATSPTDTWKINCATKPLMKSYTVELQ